MKIDIACAHKDEIGKLFAAIGEPVRFVGGCVRDTLKGVPVKDFDLASPALPGTVMEAAATAGYRVIPTGLQHGTVTVVIGGEPYEITTLRADVETDGRHATVAFVRDYETDAARRDFTLNAMSADLDGTVHDYFGGLNDLRDGRVSFVGSLDDRITEDYLRILRFFRFRVRYGGQEAKDYVRAIGQHAQGLHRISGERIWSEMSRILVSPRIHGTVDDMREVGVLAATGFEPAPPGLTAIPLGLNSRAGGRAAIVLGLIATDVSVLERVCGRWRVSTADRDLARLALDVRETVLDHRMSGSSLFEDPYFWTDRAVEGESLDDVRAILGVLGLDDVAESLPAELPEFPLKGRDLLERGMSPGKEVGIKLRELKDAWKASRYTLGLPDMLGEPDCTREGPRP